MSAASSPFRQNGDSRLAATGRWGLRQQIDGMGWPRANLCIGIEIRAMRRVLDGPGDQDVITHGAALLKRFKITHELFNFNLF